MIKKIFLLLMLVKQTWSLQLEEYCMLRLRTLISYWFLDFLSLLKTMPHGMNGRWNTWDFFLSAMIFHDVIIIMHNARNERKKKKWMKKGIIWAWYVEVELWVLMIRVLLDFCITSVYPMNRIVYNYIWTWLILTIFWINNVYFLTAFFS